MSEQKPDWKLWRQMDMVPLWQAVALSLDREPDFVPGVVNLCWQRIYQDVQDRRGEVWFRVRLVVSHEQAVDLVRQLRQPGDDLVSLVKFAKFAVAMGWEIPAELRALGTEKVEQDVGDTWKEWAQKRAAEIVAMDRTRSLTPSKKQIAKKLAGESLLAIGKELEAQTIERHALRGWTPPK